MSGLELVGLVLAVPVLGYLLATLLRPERF